MSTLLSQSAISALLVSLESLAIVAVLALVANEFYRWIVRIRGVPGPGGRPIVGNLHQIQNVSPPEQYRLWSLKYGPLFQVQLGNIPVLIINNAAVAKDLLIGQGAAFNSRPLFYVFHKFVSKEIASIGTSPWDQSCKRRRKAAASALNVVQVDSYAPILRLESSEFINELNKACGAGGHPIDFQPFVRRFSMNLSLTLNYGTRATNIKDFSGNPLINEISYVESHITRYRSTSSNIKNYIPLLRLLDPLLLQLPGNSLQKALDIGKRRLQYHHVLLETLKSQIEQKSDKPCIQGSMLKDAENKGLSDMERLSVSLSIMAGANSNTPTLSWGILFLAHHQEIQEKAFQAIQDSHVLDDDPFGNGKVPYVEALTKELNRYYSVLRLAMPKEATVVVNYNGIVIPKGTMIFLNTWACNHDSDLFPEPFEFIPERWLENPNTPAHQFAFGMGSRMCVASHLAQRALYLAFLHLIAHFHIEPASDEESASVADPIEGARDLKSTATAPKASRARFTPRSVFNITF